MQFNLNVGHLRKQSLASLKDTLARVRITAQNRSINNLFEDSIFGALHKIVDVQKKQQWSQNRSLRHAERNKQMFRFLPNHLSVLLTAA